jgi:hypothetical protein
LTTPGRMDWGTVPAELVAGLEGTFRQERDDLACSMSAAMLSDNLMSLVQMADCRHRKPRVSSWLVSLVLCTVKSTYQPLKCSGAAETRGVL